MSVSLNVYINENLMFTELSFYEWIFVRVKKHLSDNVHFTDNRRRTSIFTRRKCLLYSVIPGLNMLTPGRDLSVRPCVCLSLCLSVTAFYLNTIGPISMKLGPHDLNKNLR